MKAAHRCGLRPADFWAITPWQLSKIMEAEADASRDRHDLAVFEAWHVEAFARTKRLPKLDKVLSRAKPQASAVDNKVKAVMAMFKRAQA